MLEGNITNEKVGSEGSGEQAKARDTNERGRYKATSRGYSCEEV